MNFLGHAFLSFKRPQIVAGNIAGDFIKGNIPLKSLPEGIVRGVRLHRFIDELTDKQIGAKRAATFFKGAYGLYAYVIVDILLDHFLANDARYFPTAASLEEFAQETYAVLESEQSVLPEKFTKILPFMIEQNWLYSYRSVRGIEKALKGLSMRASQIGDMSEAYRIFISHYYELNQCYYEVIDFMINAVKFELSEMP